MTACNLTSTASRTEVKRSINEHYRRLGSALGMTLGRDSTTTITMVAGTQSYSVTAQKIKFIRDASNSYTLREVSLGYIRDIDPGLDSSGNPEVFAIRKQTATTITVLLHPIPSAAGTLDVDISTALTALSANGDVPVLIPEDFHWLLSSGAKMDFYEKSDDQARYDRVLKQYEQGIKDLRYFLRKSHTHTFTQGERVKRPSRLSPFYPE